MDKRFIQGTPEWLEMRRTMVMASDAPIVMGDSKWKTPRELYFEKIEGGQERETPSMKRGKEMEAEARSIFEETMGENFPPSVIISPTHSWMGASLDGMSSDGRVLEIKCPGKADHEKAIGGTIPAHYFAQLQCQMLITGASEVYYFSYSPKFEEKGVILIQLRDEAYIAHELFPKCQKFFKHLKEKNPPEPTEKEKLRDSLPEPAEISLDDEKFYFAEEELFLLLDKKKQLLKREEELKEFLIKKANGRPIKGTYFSINPRICEGKVDYKMLLEENKLNIEPYRQESIVRWEVRSL